MRPKPYLILRWLSYCLSGLLLLGVPSSVAGETKTVTFKASDSAVTRDQPLLIGANVHFGTVHVYGYTSPIIGRDQLHAIGANSFRDYLPWQSFKYTATGPVLTKSQRLMRFLEQQSGFRPLINLGLTNSFVSGGLPPISDEGLRYFETYLQKAVEVTKDYKPIYEIWNEWNIGIGDGKQMPRLTDEGPAADPRAAVHYVRIAKTAIRTIRQTDPNATILVGAVGDDVDWAWAKAIVRGGALEGADGLSIHLYNHCMKAPSVTANEMIERAQALQSDLQKLRGGKVTPIYISEYGWPTHKGPCEVEPERAASNFAQFILQGAALPWVKGIWMHELKNIGANARDPENNFGLFAYDNAPKPAACFVREATAIVRAAQSVEIIRPFPGVFLARVRSGDRQKILLWTSSNHSNAQYEMPAGTPAGAMMCSDRTLAAQGEIALSDVPVVYDLDASAPISIEVTH